VLSPLDRDSNKKRGEKRFAVQRRKVRVVGKDIRKKEKVKVQRQ